MIEWAASIGKILSIVVLGEKTEVLKEIGESLRERRLRLNLSQAMAAERSGISLKAIRNLEAGRNASTLSLLCYCRTLRKVDWLMQIAPPEVDDSLFTRKSGSSARQRACPVREMSHG